MNEELAYVTIGSVVDSYLAGRNEDQSLYGMVLTLALDGLREVSLHGGSIAVSTETIDINSDTGLVHMPSQCVKPLSMALCFPGGGYLLLGYDPTMCPVEYGHSKDFCSEEAPADAESRYDIDCEYARQGQQSPWYNGIGDFFESYNAGRYVGRNFAMGAGYVNGGVWSVDYKNRTIWIRNSCAGARLIIKFQSTGISTNGTTYVDVAAIQVIKAYIDYQRELSNASMTRRIGPDHKLAEYKRQFNLNFGFRRGTSIQRIIASSRRNTGYGLLKR